MSVAWLQLNRAGSVFYYICKPKAQARTGLVLGQACIKDPEPANKARPANAQALSIKPEPNPSPQFYRPDPALQLQVCLSAQKN
jgi:hypothetical protein